MIFCCEDMKITTDMGHITIKGDIVRLCGHVINYCPFCGEILEDEE